MTKVRLATVEPQMETACSFAAHHQGACSKHGGVKVFYK